MPSNNKSIIAELPAGVGGELPGLSANEISSELRRGSASNVILSYSVQRKNTRDGNFCLAVRKAKHITQ